MNVLFGYTVTISSSSGFRFLDIKQRAERCVVRFSKSRHLGLQQDRYEPLQILSFLRGKRQLGTTSILQCSAWAGNSSNLFTISRKWACLKCHADCFYCGCSGWTTKKSSMCTQYLSPLSSNKTPIHTLSSTTLARCQIPLCLIMWHFSVANKFYTKQYLKNTNLKNTSFYLLCSFSFLRDWVIELLHVSVHGLETLILFIMHLHNKLFGC